MKTNEVTTMNKILSVAVLAIVLLSLSIPATTATEDGGNFGHGSGAVSTSPISKFLHFLSFYVGELDFELGTGVSKSYEPWRITGERSTFTDEQRVYALLTLEYVYNGGHVTITFKNRNTGQVEYVYQTDIPDPYSQGYTYWEWWSVYAYIDPRPAGTYEVSYNVANTKYGTKLFYITSTQPTPTPTPTGGKVCTPYEYRCNGNNRERCTSTGTAWVYIETCSYKCENGQCVASTPTPTYSVCTPGERKCDQTGNKVLECVTAGNGWKQLETCPYGCVNGACQSAPIPTPTPTPDIPGFSAILAISGLLAISAILLKKRDE